MAPRVRVGIIGCGEVAQVVHIPTLGFFREQFEITYLCDASREAIEYCLGRVFGSTPTLTTDPKDVCASETVDLVMIMTADEYHTDQAILALQNNKFVFVEKPLALNARDIERIEAAEKASQGKLMVGYMRRHAAAFIDGIKEIGGMDKILYARVRGMSIRSPSTGPVMTEWHNRYHRTKQHLRISVWHISDPFHRLQP